MKKIITLILSIILILGVSVTVFAEPNTSSEPISSSEPTSSSEPSSSMEAVSSTTSSETQSEPEIKPTLTIVSLPKKTEYEIGETLNLNGLKVNIVDESGMMVSHDGNNLIVSPTALNKEGKQKIEVKYQDVVVYFEVKVNAKHEHKFGEWKIEVAPTCQSTGKRSQKCACGAVATEVMAKAEHDWDEGAVIKPATYKEEGQIRYVCTVCKKESVEKLPVLVKAETPKKEFKFSIRWWMVLAPIAFVIILYIAALKSIFKKKV